MNGRGRRSDQPDGDGVLGRAHRVETGYVPRTTARHPRITGYRILRRRPALGEDGLLEYVVNTRSTAATFTDRDVTTGEQHVYRVQAISAEGRSQRSNYVNVTP